MINFLLPYLLISLSIFFALSSDLSLGETDDAIVNEHDNVADTPANVEVNKPADNFSANDNEHLAYKHQYSSKEEEVLLQALLSERTKVRSELCAKGSGRVWLKNLV